MSTKGQKRTLARYCDSLVGGGKYCRRNGEAECLCGFEIDDYWSCWALHGNSASAIPFSGAINSPPQAGRNR